MKKNQVGMSLKNQTKIVPSSKQTPSACRIGKVAMAAICGDITKHHCDMSRKQCTS
uniref:Uncharacterized protein n=1 Tax=Ciona savignyi TaxID=51511 RepID=H2YLW2_CIOSA